jgi:hypothetical protein
MVEILFTDQQVVLAYGAESDRSLGIPGEVILLTTIVNIYATAYGGYSNIAYGSITSL